jgi:uncharacterized caspase-like protein
MLGRRRLMAASLLLACGIKDAKAEEKRIALVIGNGDYAHVQKLPNAVNDAHVMALELAQPSHGFQVTYGHDLSRASMWSTINDFVDAVHRYDAALFYFAGHGVQINNANWLVPVDISDDLRRGEDVQEQSVDMARVAAMIANANPRGINMLIIDACRDNPFAGNGIGTGAPRGLATTEGANGVMILYSAGSGQTALDGLTRDDSHGLFTQELLAAIRRPGVPVSQMMADLQDVVRQRAQTVHHLQTPAYYAEQGSNFMFTPPTSDLPAARGPPGESQIAIVPAVLPQAPANAVKPDASAKSQVATKPSAQGIAKPTQAWHVNKNPSAVYDPDKTCTSLGTC